MRPGDEPQAALSGAGVGARRDGCLATSLGRVVLGSAGSKAGPESGRRGCVPACRRDLRRGCAKSLVPRARYGRRTPPGPSAPPGRVLLGEQGRRRVAAPSPCIGRGRLRRSARLIFSTSGYQCCPCRATRSRGKTRDLATFGAHLDDISRNGELQLETQDGDLVVSAPVSGSWRRTGPPTRGVTRRAERTPLRKIQDRHEVEGADGAGPARRLPGGRQGGVSRPRGAEAVGAAHA